MAVRPKRLTVSWPRTRALCIKPNEKLRTTSEFSHEACADGWNQPAMEGEPKCLPQSHPRLRHRRGTRNDSSGSRVPQSVASVENADQEPFGESKHANRSLVGSPRAIGDSISPRADPGLLIGPAPPLAMLRWTPNDSCRRRVCDRDGQLLGGHSAVLTDSGTFATGRPSICGGPIDGGVEVPAILQGYRRPTCQHCGPCGRVRRLRGAP
jgi:hypothetical protein